jgi:hypothetical protein
MPRRLLSSLALLVGFTTAPLAAQDSPVVQVPALAGAKAPGFHWVIDGTVEYGGDLFLTVLFTDGSEQDIHAGQGAKIGGGFEYRLLSNPRLAFGGTVGLKFVTTADSESDISFTRVPIEMTARWSLTDDWWAAGGLTHHTAIEFDGDGIVPDESLPSATGLIAEVGWKWIGLRLNAISYQDSAGEFDASSVGITFRWVSRGRR